VASLIQAASQSRPIENIGDAVSFLLDLGDRRLSLPKQSVIPKVSSSNYGKICERLLQFIHRLQARQIFKSRRPFG
jgi:hypothetical protein